MLRSSSTVTASGSIDSTREGASFTVTWMGTLWTPGPRSVKSTEAIRSSSEISCQIELVVRRSTSTDVSEMFRRIISSAGPANVMGSSG